MIQILLIIIYIIGYIWAYYITKLERTELHKKGFQNWNTWFDVSNSLFISIFSWLYIINYYISKTKPPNWL